VVHKNDLRQDDIDCFFHPVTDPRQHEKIGPVVMVRGQGVYVYDDTGRKYLEAMAGLWSVAVGFSDQRLVDAGARQLSQLPFYHSFSHKSNPEAIQLAKTLSDLTPDSVSHVFFSNSGSDANDTAIKLIWNANNARGLTSKKHILSRDNAYHGVTVASGSLTGMPVMHADFDLPRIPVTHLTCPHFYRHGMEGESEAEFVDRLCRELEETIAEVGSENIAAFWGEPVMGAGGVLPPPTGYWPRVQEILRENDILLVVDEVISGFGRLGTMFASDHYGIEPDILVLSKQLTSSYAPLAAIVISDDLYQDVADNSSKRGVFGHGFTTSGHPLSTALANENLKIIQDDALVARAEETGAYLQLRLREFADHPLVGEVRGVGLIGALELVRNKETRERFEPYGKVGRHLVWAAQRAGVIFRAIGDQVAICPPLIIERKEIDVIIEILELALEDTAAWIPEQEELG